MIFLIFIGADVMNSALALTQVPAQLSPAVQQSGACRPTPWSPPSCFLYMLLGSSWTSCRSSC